MSFRPLRELGKTPREIFLGSLRFPVITVTTFMENLRKPRKLSEHSGTENPRRPELSSGSDPFS